MSDNDTATAESIARALLRTPRDTKLLMEFVDSAAPGDRGCRAARALLAVEGIPMPRECPLTPMQHAVLEQLAKGNMYSEIALEMELSPSTVRTHINGCIVKLGVRDRGQAVIKAYKEGWI